MRRHHLKVFCAAVVLLGFVIILSACGSSVSRVIQSPFTGQWNGSWIEETNDQEGELSLTVARDGKLSGSISNSTLSLQGSVEGSISATGQISTTLSYPADLTYAAEGVVVKNSSGDLVGNLQMYGTPYGTLQLDLKKN